MVNHVPCSSNSRKFSAFIQGTCPTQMQCVPREVLHISHDGCSCEFAGLLIRNTANGAHCTASIGSYLLVPSMSILGLLTLVLAVWVAYVILCVWRSGIWKKNTICAALALTLLCCIFMSAVSIFTSLATFESSAMRPWSTNAATATVALLGIAILLALCFTGKILFAAMVELTATPLDDQDEHWRNVKCFFVVLAHLLLCIPLLAFGMPSVALLIGGLLGLYCWRIFRHVGSKLTDNWSVKMLNRTARGQHDQRVKVIQSMLKFINRTIVAFLMATILQGFGWYMHRAYSDVYTFEILRAVGELLQATAITGTCAGLVYVLSTITHHKIANSVRMQVIALTSSKQTVSRVISASSDSPLVIGRSVVSDGEQICLDDAGPSQFHRTVRDKQFGDLADGSDSIQLSRISFGS
jgi:hypothetical protein